MSKPPPPPPPIAPSSGVPAPGGGSLNDVADGQRWVIYAILLNIGSLVLRVAIGDLWAILGIAAIVLGVVGVLRLCRGLGYSTVKTVLFIALLILPLLSIVMLAILSARANEALKAGGYKVGLLGAKR